MAPSKLRKKVITERTEWINNMLAGLRSLPLENYEAFTRSPNIAAAESYLRRALEALLDLGRHILAKRFGKAVAEYKVIAAELERFGVLSSDASKKLRILAGYRNRMLHFYNEISDRELYEICTGDVRDIEGVLSEILNWIKKNPDSLESEL